MFLLDEKIDTLATKKIMEYEYTPHTSARHSQSTAVRNMNAKNNKPLTRFPCVNITGIGRLY